MIPIEQIEDGFIEKSTRVFSEAYNEIIVNADDPIAYEKLRDEIIEKLMKIEDDGEKIVQKALKKEKGLKFRLPSASMLLANAIGLGATAPKMYLCTLAVFSCLGSIVSIRLDIFL